MIESRMTKLARILAVRTGLTVVQGRGIGASTDGKKITVPNFSDAKAEKMAEKLRLKGVDLTKVLDGLLGHESAHCYLTFTEMNARQLTTLIEGRVSRMIESFEGFDAVPFSFRKKAGFYILKTLSNFSEDRRIEFIHTQRFPGEVENLVEVARFDVALGDDHYEEEAETAESIKAEAADVLAFYKKVHSALFTLANDPAQAAVYAECPRVGTVAPETAEFVSKHFSYETLTSAKSVSEVVALCEAPAREILLGIFEKAKDLKLGAPKPKPSPKSEEGEESEEESEKSEGGESEEGEGGAGFPEMEESEGSEDEESEEESEEEGSEGSEDEESEEGSEEEESDSTGEKSSAASGSGAGESGTDELAEGEGSEGEESAPAAHENSEEGDGEPERSEPNPDAEEILSEIEEAVKELSEEDRTKEALKELTEEADRAEREVRFDLSADPLKAWEAPTTEWDVCSPAPKATDPSKLDFFRKQVSEIAVGHIGRKLLGEYRNRWTPGSEGSRVNLRQVGPLAAGIPNFRQLFITKENKQHRKGTAVELVVDLSGSMNGDKRRTALLAAGVLGDLLQRLGIPFEVIGFTTGRRLRESSGIRGWTRHENLLHPIFKGFNEPMAEAESRMAEATDMPGNQNVDGESVMFCANRLLARNEKRKIMVVLSDGDPAYEICDYTKANAHLKAVCKKLEATPGFELYGIGIHSAAVRQFYKNHVVLKDVAELPSVLGALFSGNTVGFRTHDEKKVAAY